MRQLHGSTVYWQAICVASVFLAGCPSNTTADAAPPAADANVRSVRWVDRFDGPTLDTQRWLPFVQHDVRKHTAGIRKAPDGSSRLVLAADTIGTRDETVKLVGVRTVRPEPIAEGLSVSFEFDWNAPYNAAYLSMAVYLCPTATTGDPEDEPNWLKFSYVGVPQDQKVRAEVALKKGGHRRFLQRDGWPKVRKGRDVGRARIELMLGPQGASVLENGKLRASHGEATGFGPVYIYLRLSSHSNYFQRAVLFDDVEVADAPLPLTGG